MSHLTCEFDFRERRLPSVEQLQYDQLHVLNHASYGILNRLGVLSLYQTASQSDLESISGMDDDFVFIWTIEKFNWCLTDVGKSIYSPVFVADTPYQTHWRLQLFPKGHDGKHIACYLQCHEYNENIVKWVDFKIGLVGVNNTMPRSFSMRNIRFSRKAKEGFKNLASWDFLLSNENEFLPEGTLKLQCNLKASKPVCQHEEDLDTLSETFKRMFKFGDYSDLTLLGSNMQFPVHRAILSVRSLKYGKIIRNKLNHITNRENLVCKIPAGDVPYEAFEYFLRYLYCGVMDSTDPVVWYQLYEMAEAYNLYDMKREIFPTETESSARTRILTTSKSIVFPVKNFSNVSMASMGRFVDVDFARVTVEFYSNGDESFGFLIWCFTSDIECADKLFCSASVLDKNGDLHFTSVCEVKHDDDVTTHTLPFLLPKVELMNDSFLISDTVSVKFTFTVLSGFEPWKMETHKVGSALCLGHEPPSRLTLDRLSKDFEQLAMWEVQETMADSSLQKIESLNLEKAIFSAWSPACEELFQINTSANSPNVSIFRNELDKLVYRFLYTGRIEIPDMRTALNVYSKAKKFEIDSLKKLCFKSIESKLNVGNAIETLILSQSYPMECLDFILNFVCNHFNQLSTFNEWKYLAACYPFILDRVKRRLRILNFERLM